MLLAASIFTSVILIGVSTFTKMNQLNDRATEQRSVSENGRFAMEAMTRAISNADGYDYDDSTVVPAIGKHLQSVQICDNTGANGMPVSPFVKTSNRVLVTVESDDTVVPPSYVVSRFSLNDQHQLVVLKSDNPGTPEILTSNDVTVESFALSGVSAVKGGTKQPYVSVNFTVKAVPLRSVTGAAQQEFQTSTEVRDYLFQNRAVTTLPSGSCAGISS